MELSARHAPLPEVFSLDEIARAADVPVSHVRELVDRGVLPTHGTRRAPYVAWSAAVEAVAALSGRRGPMAERLLFSRQGRLEGSAGLPLASSGIVHLVVAVAAFAMASTGLTAPRAFVDMPVEDPSVRLIFVATPGPGGGGGGGGARQPARATPAERTGTARVSSPVPRPRPPAPVAPARPPEILTSDPLPTLVAPVALVAADEADRRGVLDAGPLRMSRTSAGPGADEGAGSGRGSGIGEGAGGGLGPGLGGGTGGGAYRPGSGITPPRLLREIKPDYTESARVQGIEGEVVLEILVRRDGSVGDVRLVERLGYGLDERAIAAVRQWRFAPAERQGVPVDLVVEVALEFRSR